MSELNGTTLDADDSTTVGAGGSPERTAEEPTFQRATEAVIESRGLDVYYGDERALRDVDVVIPRRQVTAIIGPSGCGKSTFLRCINRTNDLVQTASVDGELWLGSANVYGEYGGNVAEVGLRAALRRRSTDAAEAPEESTHSDHEDPK